MENKITITEDMIAQACDYIPNADKQAWVIENAAKCFDKLEITADGEAVPPMYMVNEGLKRRYLMAAFAEKHLHQHYEPDEKDAALMSEAEYDRWAGSHVFGQMQRMKHIVSARDKCFDILEDWRDLTERFQAQLNGLLAVQNDAVMRQGEYTASQMKELPEVLKQLREYQEARTDGGLS